MTKTLDILSKWRMLLFTIAAGILVANLYYVQPLILEISKNFGNNIENAGYLATFIQLGYAFGILFIIPLGDYKDRRKMISIMLPICGLSLLVLAFSKSFMIFSIASIINGITSSATMIIVPYVASHSPNELKGKNVGQIMTGVLLGILLARTVSGYVSYLLGWRVMYVIASALVFILAVLLRKAMVSNISNKENLKYSELIFSLGKIFFQESELRWRSWYALLGYIGFSILWTGLTFLLSNSYNYNTKTIGLFGLIGATGALSANIAGRLGDKGYAKRLTVVLAGLMMVSWILLEIGGSSLIFLVIGLFVIDVAVQGLQITHQSVLYRISTNASSRITSVFITSTFIGMSMGSAISSIAYHLGQWKGICFVGGIVGILLTVSIVIQMLLNIKNKKVSHI